MKKRHSSASRNKLLPFISFLCLYFVSRAGAQDRSALLRKLFDTLYTRQHFNGCVLIADSGRPIFKAAYGFADIDRKIPLMTDTRFEIASVSKQFTAMSIMQLEEKGQLKYSDDIRKYIPGLPYQGVTIEDLLRHTSGIGDFMGWAAKEIDTALIHNNEDILKLLPKNIPALSFEPGTKFSYSNTNYLLLALIVAKVSGQPFAKYMEEGIFRPAHMINTSVYARMKDDKQPDNYALSYIWDPVIGKFIAAEDLTGNRYLRYLGDISGPYGISSTVEDLLKWDQILYTDGLVKEVTLRKAFEPKLINDSTYAGIGNEMPYGYGWILSADTANKFVWHTGGLPGYTSLITRFTTHRLTVIVLQNIWNMVSPNALMGPIAGILDYNGEFEIPTVPSLKKSMRLSIAELTPYVGNYLSNDRETRMIITLEGGRLYAKFRNQLASEILPFAPDMFVYREVDAVISFVKTNEEKYNKLVIKQNGGEMEFSRIE